MMGLNLYRRKFKKSQRLSKGTKSSSNEKLNCSEILLRTIFDSSPLGYLLVDTRTDKILYSNRNLFEIWKIEAFEKQIQTGELKGNDIAQCFVSVVEDPESFSASWISMEDEKNRTVIDDVISLSDGRTIKQFSTQLRGENDAFLGRLFVFGDITPRKNFEDMLRYRHDYEHFIFSISSEFVNTKISNIDSVIVSCLKRICEYIGADQGLLCLLNEEQTESHIVYKWNNENLKDDSSRLEKTSTSLWNWSDSKLRNYEIISIEDVNSLSDEAAFERNFWKKSGISSVILAPLVYGDEIKGTIIFNSVARKSFSDDNISMLGMLSGIFSNAVMHKTEYEAVLLSEEKLRLLVQNASDLITVIDMEGMLIYNSPAAKNIFGYSEDNWKGKDIFDFIHIDDLPKVKEYLRRAINNSLPESEPIELRVKHFDGSWRSIESVVSNQLNNPAIMGIIINSHDVTRHVEMQEALRNSSRFLNKIIDSIGDPLFVKNREHKWVLLNEALCDFIGYTKEEILGKEDFDLFKKEEAELFFKIDEAIFNSGRNNINEEEVTNLKGTTYHVSTRKNLFIDESGAKYIIGTIRDETGKKEAELNMLNSLAKEKELNDLKSTFISMVSHEYRTPLTAILSSAELLELFGSRMNYEEKQEHFDKIRKAVEFLIDLLNDVLLINRKESGRLEFHPLEFELGNFCSDLIKESAAGDEHRIVFSSNIEHQKVYMDVKLCKHILSNLITNALKYSPDDSTVEFNLNCNGNNVIFEIIDHGIGISENDQARIFDPFFRARNTAGIPGSGLGLPIVKNCVELHKGELTFESRLNVGTVFRVSLPAMQEYL